MENLFAVHYTVQNFCGHYEVLRGHAMFNASVTIVTFNYHHCLLHFTAVAHHCRNSHFFPLRLQTSSATVASLPTQIKSSSFTSKCSFWHKCWQIITIFISLLLFLSISILPSPFGTILSFVEAGHNISSIECSPSLIEHLNNLQNICVCIITQ